MKKTICVLCLPLLLYGCGTNIENAQLRDYGTTETTSETTAETYEDTYVSFEHQTVTDDYEIESETITDDVLEVTLETTVSDVTTTDVTTSTETVTTTTAPVMGFDDEELLVLAKSLYDVACEMAWNYYCDCPYTLDYDSTVKDTYGNTYYLISDTSITSIEDIKEDWLEVFSSKYYPTDFGNRFIESGGRVYANDASRGGDISYSSTDISEITSKSEDGTEVFFNAVSHYVDPNDNSPMDDQIEEFSIILEDGSYHVGKFTLPY